MATEDGAPGGVHHEDCEWETQKANFTRYYMQEKMTLIDATQRMIDHHQFHATPRQWERRVAKWGLSKYTSREARLNQIAAQGKSVLEVAQSPRRPRSHHGDGLLRPEPDRNVKRFARREVGRSRSRSRSTSCGQYSRSPSASPAFGPHSSSEQITNEKTFNLDFPALGGSSTSATVIPAELTNRDSGNPQAHVMEIFNPITGETGHEIHVSVPGPPFASGGSFDSMAFSNSMDNFDLGDLETQFAPDQVDVDQAAMTRGIPFDAAYPPHQNITSMQQIANASPIYGTTGWNQHNYDLPTSNSHDFAHVAESNSQSFHRNSIEQASPTPFPPFTETFNPPQMPIPQLIEPDNAEGDFSQSQTQTIQPQLISNHSYSGNDSYPEVLRLVNDYMSAVFDEVIKGVGPTNDPQHMRTQLIKDLNHKSDLFMHDMFRAIDSYTGAKDRAIHSIIETCRGLRQKNEALKQQNAQLSQLANQIPAQMSTDTRSRHFSDPNIYVQNTNTNNIMMGYGQH